MDVSEHSQAHDTDDMACLFGGPVAVRGALGLAPELAGDIELRRRMETPQVSPGARSRGGGC